MTSSRRRNSKKRIWFIPVIISLITGIGLFLALTGNENIDFFSNIALAVPAIITAFAIIYRE